MNEKLEVFVERKREEEFLRKAAIGMAEDMAAAERDFARWEAKSVEIDKRYREIGITLDAEELFDHTFRAMTGFHIGGKYTCPYCGTSHDLTLCQYAKVDVEAADERARRSDIRL